MICDACIHTAYHILLGQFVQDRLGLRLHSKVDHIMNLNAVWPVWLYTPEWSFELLQLDLIISDAKKKKKQKKRLQILESLGWFQGNPTGTTFHGKFHGSLQFFPLIQSRSKKWPAHFQPSEVSTCNPWTGTGRSAKWRRRLVRHRRRCLAKRPCQTEMEFQPLR